MGEGPFKVVRVDFNRFRIFSLTEYKKTLFLFSFCGVLSRSDVVACQYACFSVYSLCYFQCRGIKRPNHKMPHALGAPQAATRPTWQVGEQWIGEYTCEHRQNPDLVDVRRVDLVVTEVNGSHVKVDNHFFHQDGAGEYNMSGTADAAYAPFMGYNNARCHSIACYSMLCDHRGWNSMFGITHDSVSLVCKLNCRALLLR